MSDEPEDHKSMDAAYLVSGRTTKAYACSCPPHLQWSCAYHRMGYCTDRAPEPRTYPKFKKPTLVVDNSK